jgi:hypothetical protein
VTDLITVNPYDPQDVALLSIYHPQPGPYTFYRSFDGGTTWTTQRVEIATAGGVRDFNWARTSLVVSFNLTNATAPTALVAFPP